MCPSPSFVFFLFPHVSLILLHNVFSFLFSSSSQLEIATFALKEKINPKAIPSDGVASIEVRPCSYFVAVLSEHSGYLCGYLFSHRKHFLICSPSLRNNKSPNTNTNTNTPSLREEKVQSSFFCIVGVLSVL